MAKYTLTITDATAEEIKSIALFLNGASVPALIASNGPASTPGLVTAMDGSITTMPPVSAGDDDSGPVNTNAPTIDTTGMPWDERIHSKNRNTNADGTWRAKRNVDPALKAGVEAELKSRTVQQFTPPAAPTFTPPPYQPQPSAPTFTPPPMPSAMPNEQPQQFTQPQAYPAPSGPPSIAPYAPPPAAMDFGGFMQHLTGQMNKKDGNGFPLITVEYLMSVCQRIAAQTGVQTNSITDIATNPAAINLAVMFINGDGRWN